MRFSKYCAFPVLCFSLLALAYSEFANANETQYQIEISKSANSLVVKKGERAIKIQNCLGQRRQRHKTENR